jgi:uncharacterized protein (TIGR02284 family)
MALSTQKIIEELNELIRFDFDAVGAYDEAIAHIHEAVVTEPLTRFRGDHERHIAELSAIVRRIGGKPVDKADFKGIVRKTMTKIAGAIGTEAALMAMKSNEDALNKAYAHHATMDFPKDILDVVQRNYADEQRHLAWIEQALRTRLWEQQPTTHP